MATSDGGPSVLFLTLISPDKSDTHYNELRAALQTRGATVQSISFQNPSCQSGAFLSSFTHIIFITCDGYNKHIASFKSFIHSFIIPLRIKHPHIRIMNPASITLWNTNKTYLLDLEAAHFPIPQTRFLDPSTLSLPTLRQTLSSHPTSSPVVLKPSISASAFCTHLLSNPHDLSSADDAVLADLIAKLSTGDYGALMLQAYVPELVAQGEYSLIFIEGRCTHAVRKVAASGEFRVNWEFGGRQVFMESGEAPEAGLATATRMWEWLSEKLRSEGTGEELMYMRLDGAIREDGEFVVIEVELIEPYLWLLKEGPGKAGFQAFCDAIFKA